MAVDCSRPRPDRVYLPCEAVVGTRATGLGRAKATSKDANVQTTSSPAWFSDPEVIGEAGFLNLRFRLRKQRQLNTPEIPKSPVSDG